jgi:molybdopterin converting factor small subunit
MLFMIEHTVKEGGITDRVVSRRMQFVGIDPAGQTTNAGWAPHLDLSPIGDADRAVVADVLNAEWLKGELENAALAHASAYLVPEHFVEVRDRLVATVDKTLRAVHDRLTKELDYWNNRFVRLKEDAAAGKQTNLNIDNVRQTINDLAARLTERKRELEAMRHVVSATPVVLGGALVIPAGLLAQRRGEPGWTADAAARRRVELAAMKAVMDAERALGHTVYDVSSEKCGWDVTALPPTMDGKTPLPRHIEVKGRAKGADTVTVTRNEIMYALNQQDKFWLALVEVDGDSAGEPRYIARPFTEEPHWATTSINLDLKSLLKRSLSADGTKGGIE